MQPKRYRLLKKGIEPCDIFMFFAVTMYMGVVRLPSVEAYWKPDKCLPDHFFTKDISFFRYSMLWRCIHITPPDGGANEIEDTDDASFMDDDDEDGTFGDHTIKDERWFQKVGPLFDHVRRVCKTLVVPGGRLAIDEMMVRFFGRSAQTFRMRNKPVREGYKVMALACSYTGFVYAMTPDGRIGGVGEVEAEEGGKIASLVTHLTDQLPPPHNFKYVIAMDNYFTTPRTMQALRERDVGAMGTARRRKGWPPKELCAVNSTKFNECHYTVDEVGSHVYRWVDNNVVTFVTTVHEKEISVTAKRKKPRMTATNRECLKEVWGDAHTKEIKIPQFIDDYNHNMNAVDRADQLIATYTMKHRCCRSWTPFLLYIMNIIRINSFIVHRELDGNLSHLDFTLGLVRALYERRLETRMTRKRTLDEASPVVGKRPVHKRMRNLWSLCPKGGCNILTPTNLLFTSGAELVSTVDIKRPRHELRKKRLKRSIFVHGDALGAATLHYVKHALTYITLKTYKNNIFLSNLILR